MKYIIAGGTGFIGQALTKRWVSLGYHVIVIGRWRSKIQKIFGETVEILEWSELSLEKLQDVKAIINLGGVNIGERRWTAKRKQQILQSRQYTTQKLASLCAQLGAKSPVLLNANGVGIYGAQQPLANGLPAAFTEQTEIDYQQFPDFLAKVGQTWEQALDPAIAAGVRVVKMRFGVTLDRHGGVLSLLSLPYRFFLGGPLGTGYQPFPWVSLIDLCEAIEFLIAAQDVSGPINIVAPEGITQKQFSQALGKALHRPAAVTIPAWFIKFFLGEMGEELLLTGQHVYPQRLIELGFKFTQPNISSALRDIYPSEHIISVEDL